MIRYVLPLGIFLVLAIFLGWALFGRDMLNSSQQRIESMLEGKAVPAFKLQQLHEEQKSFSSAEMRGKVWLVNVWASWCVSCTEEHPILTAMKKDNVPIYGLNYQDRPLEAKQWLLRNGDPYILSVIDNGRTSLDFGVYGVPETFVVDKKGIVRKKFTGPISAKQYDDELKPLLKDLNNASVEG